jgi:hypothetical protein
LPDPETSAARPGTAALGRGRRIAVWALVVLASLIGLVAILTTWVNRQMLDNRSWEDASRELIQDPEVRAALSVYLVNQLYDNVDVSETLQERLPPNLSGLAAPLAGALREPSARGVEFMLARPRIQELWVNSSTAAHQRLVNVLKNETGFGISTGEGVVTLDLRELLRQLGVDLGLPAAVVDRLPPDAGVITVMESDQLGAAQKAVRAIEVLSVWLGILVLGLFALAIYLARGIRRETLRNIGWAFVLVGLLVLVTRRVLGGYAVDALTQPEFREEGRRVWLIGSSILGQIGRAAILYGLVGVLGAVLAGPTGVGVAARRRLAPVLNERPGLVWVASGAVYLLLVLWGGTHALRAGWGIILLGGLVALGIVALRRQTLREYPDGVPPDATAEPRPSILSRVRGESASASPPAVAPAASASVADELARLGELRSAGVISSDEFDRAKQLALG